MNRAPQSLLSLTLVTLLAGQPFFAQPLWSQTSPANVPSPGAATPLTTVADVSPRAGEGITTIRTRTNLVVIDVVVSDAKGNPIHGLKKSDFVLSENGKPQQVRNFDEKVTLPESELAKMPPIPKLPPGLFSNQLRAPENGPANVILLDTLNTTIQDQPFVRQQLQDYLNKMKPGTRIAIFSLTSALNMLQGFTSNPAVLKAALASKGNPRASDLLNNPLSGGTATDTTLSTTFAGAQDGTDLSGAQALANVQRFEALQTAFELQLRAKFTLGAFNLLAKYLIGIPGRKNVIWFSGSFPLNIAPDPTLQDPNDAVVTNDEELRKTDNLLAKAQIAVYPVDAGGLKATTGIDIATNSTTSMVDFFHDNSNNQETMLTMAEDTGGHAFLNTNGLSEAVAKAVDNGSNYYTLTYTPTDTRYDARFRSIKVQLATPPKGVSLTYRKGYYAIDPYDKNKLTADTTAMVTQRASTMSTAMMRGGPDPTEILFKVRIRPAAAPPDATPIKGSQVNPDPKMKVAGPYQQYGIDLAPDPKSVNCPTTADGAHHCRVEVATYVYDADGGLAVKTTNAIGFTLTPAKYAEMLKYGMPFHQQVSVPVKGQYFIRTAVHDLTSDRVGAVEIAVADVAKLKPLGTARPATPAPAPPAANAPVAPDAAAPVAPGAKPAADAKPTSDAKREPKL